MIRGGFQVLARSPTGTPCRVWVCSSGQKPTSVGLQCHLARHCRACSLQRMLVTTCGKRATIAVQTNCFAEANFGRCQRVVSFFLLSSPFSLVLFLCSLVRGCSFCRSHLPQSLLSVHGHFSTTLRSRFWDRQAVRIFGPQPLTPTVRLTTASPGHVIHFAVQPEYGRLIGIFPCSQKVEITLRRNTLHLSRFWLQTFRVA